VPFAEALYNNERFARSLHDALTDDGILLIQVGFPPSGGPDMMTNHKNRAILTTHLEEVGFRNIHIYGEVGINSFHRSRSFLSHLRRQFTLQPP
jgi:spermidine synthase